MWAYTKLFNNPGERITKKKQSCVLKWSLGGNWSKPDFWTNLKSCCFCLQGWMVGTICGVNSCFRRRGRSTSWSIGRGSSWADEAAKLSLVNTSNIILNSVPASALWMFHPCGKSLPCILCSSYWLWGWVWNNQSDFKMYPIHSADRTPVSRKVHAVLLAVCYRWEMCTWILSGYKVIHSLIAKGDEKDLLLWILLS